MNNPKKYSLKREKLHEKQNPDGRRRRMSGANPIAKGDFIREHFLEELKSTGKKSISVRLSDLDKIYLEGIEHNRAGVLVFDFSSVEKKYYILTEASYGLFMQLLKEE